MSTPTPFQIRDGLESDLPDALALDHSFETDTVWQMTIRQEEGWHISFRRERLPRVIEVAHEADEKRLRSMLPGNQCFLVATRRDDSSVIGYLAMRRDYLNQIGLTTDIVPNPRQHQEVVAGTINALIRLYEETNQPDRVQEWKARLPEKVEDPKLQQQ